MDAKSFCLVNDAEKYAGKYVAMRDFDNKDVIASGNTLEDVYKITNRDGISNPVIFYVPEEDTVQIY
ncbi:MAG: hypothetical protein HQL03_07410 [Nitrospirae bacterium]|nr:hypothetical protein [Nitrospirota bacterium]MBF0590727.1 hypothetical protein [Nitrospirota bacterium]